MLACTVDLVKLVLYSLYLFTGNQWLQLDIGPPTLITAVVTKGRGDTGRKQWITNYRISYSNDSIDWTFYTDSLNLEKKVKVYDSLEENVTIHDRKTCS